MEDVGWVLDIPFWGRSYLSGRGGGSDEREERLICAPAIDARRSVLVFAIASSPIALTSPRLCDGLLPLCNLPLYLWGEVRAG